MEQYFEQQLKEVKRELTRLKTAVQKSSTVMTLAQKTITLNIPLSWRSAYGYTYGRADAEKYYKFTSSTSALFFPTLSWYAGNISQAWSVLPHTTRTITMTRTILPDGSNGIRLQFIGTDNDENSDAAKAKDGQTVTVSVDLTVTCTNDFTIEEYVYA